MPLADRRDIDAARLAQLLADAGRPADRATGSTADRPAGWSVECLDRVGSTNAHLLDDVGRPAPALVVAEEQSAGRGRFDRAWSSPRGAGLTFSLLLRPSAPLATWGWLPLLAGVALAEAVRSDAGVAASLKWPNDLLAPDGRKLAGILVQSAGGAAVVGIGLNVSATAAELPVDTATSLALAGAAAVDRTALLAAIAAAVRGWLVRFDSAAGDAGACGLASAYRELCSTVGRKVAVDLGGAGVLDGVAETVGADAALVVRAADGTAHPVHAGDVTHLR